MHLYFAVRYFWPLLVCRRRHHSDYSVCGTINHAEDSSPWRQNFLTSYQGSLWKKDSHCLLCIRLFHQPYRHDVPHNSWNSRSQFPCQGSQVCPMCMPTCVTFFQGYRWHQAKMYATPDKNFLHNISSPIRWCDLFCYKF